VELGIHVHHWAWLVDERDVYRRKVQFSIAILSFSDLEMTSQRLARNVSEAAQAFYRVLRDLRLIIRDISARCRIC